MELSSTMSAIKWSSAASLILMPVRTPPYLTSRQGWSKRLLVFGRRMMFVPPLDAIIHEGRLRLSLWLVARGYESCPPWVVQIQWRAGIDCPDPTHIRHRCSWRSYCSSRWCLVELEEWNFTFSIGWVKIGDDISTHRYMYPSLMRLVWG